MSLQELLFDNDFSKYRKMEIEEGVKIANDLMKGNFGPDYAKGALTMLKRILMLPKGLAKTDKAQNQAAALIERDLAEFNGSLVKVFVMDNE